MKIYWISEEKNEETSRAMATQFLMHCNFALAASCALGTAANFI